MLSRGIIRLRGLSLRKAWLCSGKWAIRLKRLSAWRAWPRSQLCRKTGYGRRGYGDAPALREAIGSPLPPIERATYELVVAEARKHSDEQEFAKAWEEGRRLSPEQALVST